MTTQEYNQELGALRSNMSLTIHSQYAHKLWNGRPVIKEGRDVVKPQILSMPICLAKLSQIQKDAASDDPYADLYLIEFEERVLASSQRMKELINEIADIYADNVPENMNIEGALNVAPIEYPIFVNSQLGYKLIYLLADFDVLARLIQTAAHIALITRKQSRDWLEAGARLLRQCFGIVETYRSLGITRQDVRENTARYQEVLKNIGMPLPEDVLSGEKRAEFAPEIRIDYSDAEIDN